MKGLLCIIMVLGWVHSHECDHDKIQSDIEVRTIGERSPSFGRNLASSEDIWQDDYQVKFIYIDSELDKLEAGMKDYLKDTVMPYVGDYLKKVFGVHSKRKYDFSSFTGTCYTASLPQSEQKVQETDLVILVTTQTKQTTTLASAGYCGTSTSNSRPVIGEVMINTYNFKYSVPPKQADFETMVLTIIHEIMHVMGWSNSAISTFQDFRKTGSDRHYDEPIKTVTLRDKTAKIVATPEVVKTVREHFGCSSLQGLELEDQGGSGSAGSHWDARVAPEDLMCGIIGSFKGLSKFTMALFVDSGWYSIRSKEWAHRAQIGKNKGCGFIEEKCIQQGGGINSSHQDYCPTLKASVAHWSGMACGYCGLTSDETDPSLPSYFDYWGGKKKGTYGIGDNCPLPEAYSNRRCADSDMSSSYYSGSSGWSSSNNLIPVFYGKYGTCIYNSIVNKGYSLSNRYNCLKAVCAQDNNSAVISIYNQEGSSDQITCHKDDKDQVKQSQSSYVSGSIRCPDIEQICQKYNQNTYQYFQKKDMVPYADVVSANKADPWYNEVVSKEKGLDQQPSSGSLPLLSLLSLLIVALLLF